MYFDVFLYIVIVNISDYRSVGIIFHRLVRKMRIVENVCVIKHVFKNFLVLIFCMVL